MALPTKDDLREAFEAGRAGEVTFERWFQYMFRCRDCGRTTERENIHDCPARKPAHPYR